MEENFKQQNTAPPLVWKSIKTNKSGLIASSEISQIISKIESELTADKKLSRLP